MPSQIKVDEIKNVAGQYEIKTNTFKGQTTAGSIAVQGEGTATTNLQQGLLKCSMDLNGTGTIALHDSFNISSAADNGTGIYTPSYTNVFANINYVYWGSGENANDGQNGRGISGHSLAVLAGSIKIRTGGKYDNSAEDLTHIRMGCSGDLA